MAEGAIVVDDLCLLDALPYWLGKGTKHDPFAGIIQIKFQAV